MTTRPIARAGLLASLALLGATAPLGAQQALFQPNRPAPAPPALGAAPLIRPLIPSPAPARPQTAARPAFSMQDQRVAPPAAVAAADAKASSAKPARLTAERECLARAMYFESEKSAEDGMLAVGTVVANRLKSGRYGPTVCSVVGQRGQFAPGVMSRSMTGAAADRARQMADAVLKGRRHPSAGNAMFFHVANMRFKYPNMHYVLVSGGNAFYEKRRDAAPFASMAKAMAAAKRDEALAGPIVQAALTGRPADLRPETPLAYGGGEKPAPGTALAAVAAIKSKSGPRVVSPSEPVLASIAPVAPARAQTPGRYFSETAPEANEMVALAWGPYLY